MKIVSVTFSPKDENIGGAQIPAFAFKEWCKIFGHNCDLYGISADLYNINMSNYDKIIFPHEIDLLNNYDAIFFSTPPIYVDIDIDVIRKPYMAMIHGEYDDDLYGADKVKAILSNKNCIAKIHINPFVPNYDDLFYWYPCCSPNDLISEKIIPREYNGLLYASRIRRWLNYKSFIQVANENRELIHESHMYGPCSRAETKQDVIENHGCVNIHIGAFKRGSQYCDRTGLFWDVAGRVNKTMKYNRLSLSACEALKRGYMPVVRTATAPGHFANKFIQLSNNASKYSIKKSIEDYFKYKDGYWDMINDVAANSYSGYNSVEYQVSEIIRRIKEKVDGRTK